MRLGAVLDTAIGGACEAAAGPAGLIYRDLKPGNVMVTESGIVKALDLLSSNSHALS